MKDITGVGDFDQETWASLSIMFCFGTGVGMEEEPLMLRITKREKLM